MRPACGRGENRALILSSALAAAKAFAKLKHSFLLSTSRGQQLQRQDLLKLISATTERLIGKKIGVQILRVLKTTDKLKDLDTAHELQHEMGHSAGMQRQYISRPGKARK